MINTIIQKKHKIQNKINHNIGCLKLEQLEL